MSQDIQNKVKRDTSDIPEPLKFLQASFDAVKSSKEYLLLEKQLFLWQWANQRNMEFSRRDAIAGLGFPERTLESIIKKLVDLKRLIRLVQGKALRYKLVK